MKKSVLGICLLLMGCQTAMVYRPSPAEPIALQEAAQARGVLLPQEFYFTLISQYNKETARVLVLTEPALKLADMTVSKEQIYVHEKATQVPSRLVQAWGKLVQSQFLTPCPARAIVEPAQGINGTFELEITGGVCL